MAIEPITPYETSKKARQDEKKPHVDSAVATYTKGVAFGAGAIAKLEKMTPEARKQANKYAKMINEPGTIDESKTRQGFFKKIDDKLADLKKQGKPFDAEEVKQQIFNDELMRYVAEELQKSEKKAKEEAEKKFAEAEKVQGEHEALKKKEQKFQIAAGASAAVGGIGSLVVAPADFMAGLAKFLNESCPGNHKDEFILIVKFFEAFASLVKLPFDILKIGLDNIAINLAPTEAQQKAYQNYIAAKPEDRGKKLSELSVASDKVIQSSADKVEEALNNVSGGDRLDGVGLGRE